MHPNKLDFVNLQSTYISNIILYTVNEYFYITININLKLD